MRNELLKSWSEEQYALAVKKIESYYGLSIYYLDSALGLAYTSSGCFAGLWVCNTTEYFDRMDHFRIRGFALDMEENLVIYCEDINENELYVTIK